jgi:hypothetical protein
MAVVIPCSEHLWSDMVKITTCRRSSRAYAGPIEKASSQQMAVARATPIATSRKELRNVISRTATRTQHC